MALPTAPAHHGRLKLPDEPGARAGTLSLLMLAATVAAGAVAGVLGTVLGQVVFDLDEQDLLSEAGTWGYAAAACLLVLMVLPAAAGMVLGERARRLGERRRGLLGIALNAAVAVYLVVVVGGTLFLG